MAHKHLPVSPANPSQSPIWSSLSLALSRFWFPHCKRSTGQMHHQTKVSHIPTQTNTETDPQVVYSSNPHQSQHPWLNPKTTMESISFIFFSWVSFHLLDPQYILLCKISIWQTWVHVCIYVQPQPWNPLIIFAWLQLIFSTPSSLAERNLHSGSCLQGLIRAPP